MSPSEFFEKNHWLRILGFIDKSMANLLYRHVQHEALRCQWFNNHGIDCDPFIHGEFSSTSDDPIRTHNNNYSFFEKYGDPIFDTLLEVSAGRISELVGKELIPQYTYHRLYLKGVPLVPHIDKPGTGIALSLCLGFDVSNVNHDYNWPLYLSGFPLHMNPGDLCIYRGEIIEHHRDEFLGIDQAQCFLFYSEKDSSYNIINDGRPMLGMPGNFKSEEAFKIQRQ